MLGKQECIAVGWVPSAAVAAGGGVSAQWGICLWGAYPGGVCPGGCLLGGVCHTPPVQCMLGYTPSPLWSEFLTHACENITFPQILWLR